MNQATGALTELGVNGVFPAWSPAGDLIAYLQDGGYYVARPDGSGPRRLADIGARSFRPSWSADGKYLIVSINDPRASAPAYTRLGIISVATGEVMPLGWTRMMYDAAWRP